MHSVAGNPMYRVLVPKCTAKWKACTTEPKGCSIHREAHSLSSISIATLPPIWRLNSVWATNITALFFLFNKSLERGRSLKILDLLKHVPIQEFLYHPIFQTNAHRIDKTRFHYTYIAFYNH